MFNFFVLQDILIKEYSFKNITLWSMWLTFCTGITNFLISTLIFQRYEISFSTFWMNQYYVFITFLMLFPSVLLINYLYNLRMELQEANKFSEKFKYHTSKEENTTLVRINSKYKSDHLDLDISKLLYLSSAGNYVDVYFHNDNRVDHKLIRTTLTDIEKQKIHPSLVRCQRGYIVNIEQVKDLKRVDGNDFLMFKIDGIKIPISRNYKKIILEIIGNRS